MPQESAAHHAADPITFLQNLARITERGARAWQEFFARQTQDVLHTPADPMNVSHAFMDLYTHLLKDPKTLLSLQTQLWKDYMQLWQHTTSRFLGEENVPPPAVPDARDRRFKDPAWEQNTAFDFIRQSYLVTARWLLAAAGAAHELPPQEARKIDFYTRQFVDALSPSNFLLTNPEALRTTLETGGENLVRGMENLLKDLARGGGNLRISMTDYAAFEVGKNLATTPGKVVFRNDLMELIQYNPSTETVHETPVLMIPAWINKFYILDMQPDNSIVKWLVDQGHTVFVISWVNPDEALAQKRFDDYMLEGPLAAMDAIEKATGVRKVNAVGYCLGGTLLATTLAWLHAKGQHARVASATYLTTMVDFTESGELSVFIDDAQISAMESRMEERGFLEGSDMAMTFNMLRANDLIWSFVVNNYLLGKDPFPFDLLYWNSDATRMPAAMHSFYLRNMYQQNLLVQKGGVTVAGVPIDLSIITTPTLIVSAREDHIAPWKSTYAATQIYKGSIEFVLAASGHIAGMVNPPARKKYQYWTSTKLSASPDAWLKDAKETPGSWWPHWSDWMAAHNGPQVPARAPGAGALKALADAPGEYVKVMAG